MKLRQSGEDYLETIYILSKRLKRVRSIDIANELGFSKASVSRAMGLLRENDYIIMDDDNFITFTKKGLETAEHIYDRHTTITKLFSEIFGIDKKTAAEDACQVEHVISDTTFEAIKDYMKKEKEDN